MGNYRAARNKAGTVAANLTDTETRPVMNRAIWATPLLILTLAAGDGPSLQPGKWQESVTITDVQVSNAPAVAASLKGHTTRITTCLTPAQAAQGPHIALSGGTKLCRFTGFTFARVFPL